MNLIFDIGNTRAKVALFDGGRMGDCGTFPSSAVAEMEAYVDTLCRHYPVQRAIASVVGEEPDWNRILPQSLQTRLHRLSSASNLPFAIDYGTPETLGSDRLAVVCGARTRYPEGALTVVDAGSCITIECVDAENVYRGGAILPGLRMKLRAMHEHTAKLPLLELRPDIPVTGRSTEECMLSGVVNATVFELEGFVNAMGARRVLLTGGDAQLLGSRMNAPVEICPTLLLEGLNELLKNN